MFTALNEKNISVMRLKKSVTRSLYLVKNVMLLPVPVLKSSAGYDAVRQELDAAGELGNWEYDLDTYIHCIAVLNATSPVIHPG
jgi:hypothetical protein